MTIDNDSTIQSMQRLPTEDNEANLVDLRNHDNLSHIVPDENGNLFVSVRKTKPILGIAIEGGANTKHPLPRIINIHVSTPPDLAGNRDLWWIVSLMQEQGAAYEAGGLEVGQLILEVDNTKVEGMQHQVSPEESFWVHWPPQLFPFPLFFPHQGRRPPYSRMLCKPWFERDHV